MTFLRSPCESIDLDLGLNPGLTFYWLKPFIGLTFYWLCAFRSASFSEPQLLH